MKIPITSARVHVKGEFWEEGSVLRGTVLGGCDGISLTLEIDTPGEEDRIAELVRNAERVCFVSQAVVNPVQVELSVLHNGHQVDPATGSQSA
jgi:organic hydroperoxide reductase OsmC/OhrA